MRSGDELKLQLPPMNVALIYTKTLEIKRQGTHLAIRSVENNLRVLWEVGIDVAEEREIRPMPDDGLVIQVVGGRIAAIEEESPNGPKKG